MTDSRNSREISRRHFMALTSGAAGVTAMALMGLRQGKTEGQPDTAVSQIGQRDDEVDVLVVGSGIAGVFAAVKAHDAGARVMLVSKGRLGASGQTPFARGIFSYDAVESGVSLDEFVATVSRSALGSNNPVYTRQMAEHSRDRVEELRSWGFFQSPLYHDAFSLPLEERDIPVTQRVMITHLVKEDGRMAGAAGFEIDSGTVRLFRARSVILCTGAGGFKPSGFPICDLTHDGTVMAYDIGARVTGKEWNDGHPGRGENPAACFDGWQRVLECEPSTTGVQVNHHLGVDLNYLAYMSGNPISMGPPGQGGGDQVSGGPYVPTEFQQHGPPKGPPPGGRGRPPRRKGDGDHGGPPGFGGNPMGGSSAGMAIHKAEGLVPTDDRCATDIPGLYAAGDALGSYMSGAIYTQIGSSMAGSAVQGAIAGEAAAAYAGSAQQVVISEARLASLRAEILAPLNRDTGYGPAWVTQTLQGVMIPNFVVYIKKESLLTAALAYVEELRDHHVPMLRAGDLHELRLAHETRNMVMNAEMKLRASLMRTESRCSHYRLDYPEVDDVNWRAWINLRKGADGRMKLEKHPFSDWRV